MTTVLAQLSYSLLLCYGFHAFLVLGHPATPPSSNQKCAIPTTFADKTASYKCKGDTAGKSCHKTGDSSVPQYTTAAFECKTGYVREEGKTFHSVCIDTEWQPPIAKCSKRCDKLKPVNVELKCSYRGVEVQCDDNLLPGTKVRPTCTVLHTHEDSAPSYEEITCKQDGKWDHELFSCVPDCGKPFAYAEPLIAFGEPEKYGESPWHVAVYDISKNDKILICGGTIISPQLVVSAAHCFHDERSHDKLDANKYEIIVSKVTRNYTIRDNGSQKNYKIKEIRFPKKGFIGSNNYMANNIALLILIEKIAMGPTVMPACVDWTGIKNIPPNEDTPGKIVGWGLNENVTYNEILHTTNLPYISYERCLKLLTDHGKPYLTLDKFCAGKKNGPTVEVGDSGGGLVFLEKNHYFIRGLLVSKTSDNPSEAIFTDLNDHVDWMISVRNEIEPHIIQKQTTLEFKNKN